MTSYIRRNAAREYARLGWPVLPCWRADKRPACKHGVNDATADLETVECMWAPDPEQNVAIATGACSGIVVLDVDGEDGQASLRQLEAEHGPLPDTLVVLTPNGRHHYFSHPGFAVSNRVRLRPGLDVRADGGYVVAPPSIHPSGVTYRWRAGRTPGDPLAPIPAWLLGELCPQVSEPGAVRPGACRAEPPFATIRTRTSAIDRKRVRRYVAAIFNAAWYKVRFASPGCRNDTLNRHAFALGKLCAGELLCEADVHSLVDAAEANGLPRIEAERTFRSGFTAGQQHPQTFDDVRARLGGRYGR